MTPFNWQWWRFAWGRRNRGAGEIVFGVGANAIRYHYVALGFWWRGAAATKEGSHGG